MTEMVYFQSLDFRHLTCPPAVATSVSAMNGSRGRTEVSGKTSPEPKPLFKQEAGMVSFRIRDLFRRVHPLPGNAP